jgi:hypothetical protein
MISKDIQFFYGRENPYKYLSKMSEFYVQKIFIKKNFLLNIKPQLLKIAVYLKKKKENLSFLLPKERRFILYFL